MPSLSRTAARVGRLFPHGPGDFLLQLGIWLGFALAYQIPRGLAGRDPLAAEVNGRLVMDLERTLHLLIEDDLQRAVLHVGGALVDVLNWSYWLCQFGATSLALLWLYFARNEAFLFVRNWLLLTNLLGLVGYALAPTAPPRMFPDEGFVDMLAQAPGVNHGSTLVELAANPYAAMPSLHAADALIVGFALAALVRSRWLKAAWTLWPTWVWFIVMATGNHFWLDVVAGAGVAVAGWTVVTWIHERRPEAFATVSARRRW